MAEDALIIFTTFPTAEMARTAVRTLVEERLAACGNILPQVESIYRWKGEVEMAPEVLVLLKTTIDRCQLLEQRIKSLHPYEVPEILALRVETGSWSYLQWVAESCVPA
jgi:periplasmic divalent cation tolerance protein